MLPALQGLVHVPCPWPRGVTRMRPSAPTGNTFSTLAGLVFDWMIDPTFIPPLTSEHDRDAGILTEKPSSKRNH